MPEAREGLLRVATFPKIMLDDLKRSGLTKTHAVALGLKFSDSGDRKSTRLNSRERLNSSHIQKSRMPSSA